MLAETARYEEIFEYLSAVNLPEGSESAVVFGRSNSKVAVAAGDLVMAGLADVVTISGGVGKDTGELLSTGFRSEAHFLGGALTKDAQARGYQLPPVLLEEKAMHGKENAEFSIATLRWYGYVNKRTVALTAVAHATSARRLAATLETTGRRQLNPDLKVHIKPLAYDFKPDNPADQHEAASELKILDAYPEYKVFERPADLPEDLLGFVFDRHGRKMSKPPSAMATVVLRMLPPRQRIRLLRARAGR